MLDRWDLSVRDKKGRVKVQKCFTNYLGVGVDAQVAFQMHTVSHTYYHVNVNTVFMLFTTS